MESKNNTRHHHHEAQRRVILHAVLKTAVVMGIIGVITRLKWR
ncbi:hypothetical protein [Candidatus Liberibacter sp.]|nr:hypothetical protein [Candidatus Liberibacter sp.]